MIHRWTILYVFVDTKLLKWLKHNYIGFSEGVLSVFWFACMLYLIRFLEWLIQAFETHTLAHFESAHELSSHEFHELSIFSKKNTATTLVCVDSTFVNVEAIFSKIS